MLLQEKHEELPFYNTVLNPNPRSNDCSHTDAESTMLL